MIVELDERKISEFSLFQGEGKRRLSKAEFNLILCGYVAFIVLIAFLINQNFIVDLNSHIEADMMDPILSNSTLLEQNKNNTSQKICEALVTELNLNKFKRNLNNYQHNKLTSQYTSVVDLIISFLNLTSLVILIKYNLESYENHVKKLSFVLAIIFTLTEFICLIIYVGIYIKTFHMYNFIENTINNKCFTNDMLKETYETVLFEVFVNTFIPSVKFVFSSAVILIVLHFVNLIILLYKIKLLIILNLSNWSHNNSESPPKTLSQEMFFKNTITTKFSNK